MKEVFGKIILILIPILFALGLVHLAFSGFNGNLVPTYSEVLGMVSDFPNISEMFQEASENVGAGGIMSVVGVFQMLGCILSTPFLIIGWLFTSVFAY